MKAIVDKAARLCALFALLVYGPQALATEYEFGGPLFNCDGSPCGEDPLATHFDNLNLTDYDDPLVFGSNLGFRLVSPTLIHKSFGVGASRHAGLLPRYEPSSGNWNLGVPLPPLYVGFSRGGGYDTWTVGLSGGAFTGSMDGTMNEGALGRVIETGILQLIAWALGVPVVANASGFVMVSF